MIALLPVLFNLVLSALSQFGVNVPPNLVALIGQLGPVVEKLITDLRAGSTPSAETVTILQDLVPAINAVKADTTLDPRFTEWANLLDAMVVNVTLADQKAQLGVNPANLPAE
jgi:hypothetical protein